MLKAHQHPLMLMSGWKLWPQNSFRLSHPALKVSLNYILWSFTVFTQNFNMITQTYISSSDRWIITQQIIKWFYLKCDTINVSAHTDSFLLHRQMQRFLLPVQVLQPQLSWNWLFMHMFDHQGELEHQWCNLMSWPVAVGIKPSTSTFPVLCLRLWAENPAYPLKTWNMSDVTSWKTALWWTDQTRSWRGLF